METLKDVCDKMTPAEREHYKLVRVGDQWPDHIVQGAKAACEPRIFNKIKPAGSTE